MVEKDKYVPEGVPEFRLVDFPQPRGLVREPGYSEITRAEFDQLVDRVKKLESHTEIHKESFNDFN